MQHNESETKMSSRRRINGNYDVVSVETSDAQQEVYTLRQQLADSERAQKKTQALYLEEHHARAVDAARHALVQSLLLDGFTARTTALQTEHQANIERLESDLRLVKGHKAAMTDRNKEYHTENQRLEMEIVRLDSELKALKSINLKRAVKRAKRT